VTSARDALLIAEGEPHRPGLDPPDPKTGVGLDPPDPKTGVPGVAVRAGAVATATVRTLTFSRPLSVPGPGAGLVPSVPLSASGLALGDFVPRVKKC